MTTNAQGLLLALIFMLISVILGLIAVFSIMSLNIWGIIVGFVGEGAWIFAGKHILTE